MEGREPLLNRTASTNESAERPALQPRRSLHSHHVVDEGQGRPLMEEAQEGWKPAAAELKDGMAFMLPAARTRANATYYGFIVLSLGIIVMIVILLHESREWRATVKSEGELWRDIVREVVHDIGFT